MPHNINPKGKAATREAAIASFIAQRGVTRCEPGASGIPLAWIEARVQATIREADLRVVRTAERDPLGRGNLWALTRDGEVLETGSRAEMLQERRETAEMYAGLGDD